ncbi:MAG: hypothetical protein ACYTGG_03715 [Planctomycetota bacterium]|jgi:hypothetical protein
MTWIAANLWDLLAPKKVTREPQRKRPARRAPMRDRYDALVHDMKRAHGVRVRKWRKDMSGCAWQVLYHDGSMVRLVEAPYPRGPMSCAVFLHEIGHHAIGFNVYRPRCLEEFHAWQWAIRTMRERGLNVTPSVEKRVADSLRYAVAKARRRGLKRVPSELLPYLEPAPGPLRSGGRSASPRS